MLHRIGGQKPQFFAVMDLTSGYHQAPLHEDSIPYTAFVTQHGIFEWVRVPMGLKGAPSYFQREISRRVLGGLNGVDCELYIDDCIVYGRTEEEFLQRLRKVLERFQEYGITLSPSKCRFGLAAIEYLGHKIDREGIHFIRSKLDNVLNCPYPIFVKDLSTFMGMVNYFGDHIPHLAGELRILREMEKECKVNKKIMWNDERKSQFDKVKELVNELPKLYYLSDDPKDDIIVYTDASDYAIGGHLVQRINGIERTIGFMSKTFSGPEKRWTTIEKECYAIFMMLRKYEYLLRDVHFTLKTDHANLLYLNVPPSNKVLRWKLAIQEYDATVVHIPGPENIVADALSRINEETVGTTDGGYLCPVSWIDFENEGEPPNEKLPDDVYNMIQSVHNAWCGHAGANTTHQRLKESGHVWINMRQDIRSFIQTCPTCQKLDARKIVYNTHPYVTAAYQPHQRINVDTLVINQKDTFGNIAIIVVIDTFTRWVELFPIEKLDEDLATRRLLEHFG